MVNIYQTEDRLRAILAHNRVLIVVAAFFSALVIFLPASPVHGSFFTDIFSPVGAWLVSTAMIVILFLARNSSGRKNIREAEEEYRKQRVREEKHIRYHPGERESGVYAKRIGRKDHVAAGVLGLFFGMFGIHQFYLGNSGKGTLYLLLTLFLWWTILTPILLAVVVLIESIQLLTMDEEEFDYKYNQT